MRTIFEQLQRTIRKKQTAVSASKFTVFYNNHFYETNQAQIGKNRIVDFAFKNDFKIEQK